MTLIGLELIPNVLASTIRFENFQLALRLPFSLHLERTECFKRFILRSEKIHPSAPCVIIDEGKDVFLLQLKRMDLQWPRSRCAPIPTSSLSVCLPSQEKDLGRVYRTRNRRKVESPSVRQLVTNRTLYSPSPFAGSMQHLHD